jgi:D-amino-acid dehydrogenase
MGKLNVAVVGAGIIGLSVAYHLVKAGASVTVIDQYPEGDKASCGNAGGIAVTEVVPAAGPGTLWRAFGWMMDPLGALAIRPSHAPKLIPWLLRFAQSGRPLEVERISLALAALNSRAYDDLLPMLEDLSLSGDLQRKGALTVYETQAGFERDDAEWSLKRSRGIMAEILSGADARSMEPALGPRVQQAVFTPQWSHLKDPKRLLNRARHWLYGEGASILRGRGARCTRRALGPDIAP